MLCNEVLVRPMQCEQQTRTGSSLQLDEISAMCVFSASLMFVAMLPDTHMSSREVLSKWPASQVNISRG